MKSYQIDIINPKALKLLQDLADMNLISIRESPKEDFMGIVAKLRKKASAKPLSLEEITKEVEIVRGQRYA